MRHLPSGYGVIPPTSLPGTPYQQGYWRPTPFARWLSTGLPTRYQEGTAPA
jgi:hypothetical protein